MRKQSDIWNELGGYWADKYWNYSNNRGRQLVDYFGSKDVKSFLEIGCNSGRNLYYLYKNLPGKELSGIEISKKAAEAAQKHLLHATIYNGDIHTIEINRKYDVVYTGGVLMHIEPDIIISTVKKCIDLSNKYVVHMEPIGNDIITHGPKELNPIRVREKLRCLYNLQRIYKELGYCVVNKDKYLGSKEAFIVLEK